MLGGEIVESQQRLTILDQALDGPPVFDAIDLLNASSALILSLSESKIAPGVKDA